MDRPAPACRHEGTMSRDGRMDRDARDIARLIDGRNRTAERLVHAAAAAEKKLRMRKFTWRRKYHSGPYMHANDPRLRLVARMAGAPLPMVESFVDRLDDFASENAPRGSLEGFSIAVLATHWSLPNDDILARIYAALEHPKIGWIEQDHVIDFWARNPDLEDPTAAERQDRSRLFRKAADALLRFRRAGYLDAAEYDRRETERLALRERARQGLASWRGELHALLDFSTAKQLSRCDTVTVTTIADQTISRSDLGAVENSGAGAGGTAAKLSEGQVVAPVEISTASGDKTNADGVSDEAQGELWLATEGARLVVERLTVVPARAATLIERWRARAGGSHAVLAAIIRGVAERAKTAAHFELAIGEACDRHRDLIEEGPTLAMGPAGAIAVSPANAQEKRPGQPSETLGESIERLKKAVSGG
jgi:hypothetical protein